MTPGRTSRAEQPGEPTAALWDGEVHTPSVPGFLSVHRGAASDA